MGITESELPGVGTKFEIDIGEGEQLVVIVHNSGKREVYLRAHAGADSEKVLELSDPLARKVGSILEGAYFQPIRTEGAETLFSEESTMEWFTVDPGAEIDGRTLGEARVGERTGVSVLVVQGDDEAISSPGADVSIETGDTLVVQGPPEAMDRFEQLVSGDSSDESGTASD